MLGKSRFFQFILTLSAFAVAGAAAYFSIFGLSKLFAGAFVAVVIMASSLEVGKLIVASYLYRYWKEINKAIRIYMIIAIFVLMAITSGGIYGFLSSAYQSTATGFEGANQEIGVLEQKKQIFLTQIDNYKTQSITFDNRVKTLSNIRNQQETRLDSLYKKEFWNSVNQTQKNITDANNSIDALNKENKRLSEQIIVISDSVGKIDLKIVSLKSNKFSADLGPLIYLSKLTGVAMDKVVNWFILLLIFVFDPLAISLIIASNQISLNRREVLQPQRKIKNKRKIKKPVKSIIVEPIESVEKPNIVESVEKLNERSMTEEDIIKQEEFIFEEPEDVQIYDTEKSIGTTGSSFEEKKIEEKSQAQQTVKEIFEGYKKKKGTRMKADGSIETI